MSKHKVTPMTASEIRRAVRVTKEDMRIVREVLDKICRGRLTG